MNKAVTFFVLVAVSISTAASATLPAPEEARAQAQPQSGLSAEYFDAADLTAPKLRRTDPRVDFSWGRGSPGRKIGVETFSVRWTGALDAPGTGTYRLYTQTDDGVRLWVDGELLIDEWTRGEGVREYAADVELGGGTSHEVRMEYFEGRGSAAAKLLWSGPGLEKEIVPSRSLLPTAPIACADGEDDDGDGRRDYPADPGCRSPSDSSEGEDAPEPQNPCPLPPPAPPSQPSAGGAPATVEGDRWSDPATWGGAGVPRDGESVTIPAGETVVLDRDVTLRSLQIDGTLLFDRRDIELRSDWILVHGKLGVGTEASPYTHRARIVLTDTEPGEDVMGMGDKLIGVMGGTLDLHGERRAGWTRLASTAEAGSTTIELQNSPGWREGDRIALASTDFDHEQAEEREIESVSGNTVTLSEPLDYDHYGETQTIAGCPVEERAEVALLSRNITVEGEATTSAGGVGGQIMSMHHGSMEAEVRVEGAELVRVGQKNVLRRYPIHFHMLGDAGERSYLKDTSIHDASNRCVTVHGTNRMALQRNVCYDHLGHGFFFEDGAERENVVEGNLGFGTRAPEDDERLLPTDESPATFWITNPDNEVRNNVAAGSDGMGFWIALPEHPTGLFASRFPDETSETWPRRTPLGEFSGNVSHSNAGDGLHVDGGPDGSGRSESTYYYPRVDPTDPDSGPAVAEFTRLLLYKNRGEGVWLRGEEHRVSGSVLADNAIGATFASSESYLDRSLVVGETANRGTPEDWQVDRGQVGLDGRSLPRPWDAGFPIRGYEFYDGLVGARETTFANFRSDEQRRASGLGVLLEDAFHLHPGNLSASLRFVDAERVYMPGPAPRMDGDRSAVFTDTDGSVTGTAGAVVTADNPFLLPEGCERDAAWNAYVCPPGTQHATLIVEALTGGPGAIDPVEITRTSDGARQPLYGSEKSSTDAYTNLLPEREYGVRFSGGTPTRARFVLWNGAGHHLRLVVPYPSTPRVTKYGCDLATGASWCRGKEGSLADLEASNRSAYYYDARKGRLYLKIVDPEYGWEELEIGPGR